MRSLILLLVLALIACQVNAGIIARRSTVPKGWRMIGMADDSARVAFTIGLHTQNDADLEDHLYRVSDPESNDYQEFLTTHEINERYGAKPADVAAVVAWLSKHGVTQYKPVHGAVRVITTAKIASKLFNCEIRSFIHETSRKVVAKAWGQFELPEDIHQRVEILTGLSAFPIPHKNPFKTPKPDRNNVPKVRAPDAATELVLPQTLALMYNIRQQKPNSAQAATQAVIEYEGQYFTNDDTATFATQIGYTLSNETITPVTKDHIVGTNDATDPQVESSLDIQWISAINLEATSWFWIEDGEGWLYEFGTHALNFTNPPQVTSTSYGWWEGDQCTIAPDTCQQLGVDSDGYAQAVNKLFQKLGMAGVSLLVASGDSGANGRTDEGCDEDQLRPEFPAASPFVTTVGATQVVNATYNLPTPPKICTTKTYSCISGGMEVAVSLDVAGFTSGGGFSNTTGATRPSYQDAVVQAYLASGVKLPKAGSYNAMGRGEPDVAANGHNGLIVVAGSAFPEGGTSMSSPIFAAVASFLNIISVTKTGKPLGFLNPLLYSMQAADPTTFTDITMGDNICPEDGCEPSCQGFYATKGWDPVTGLGTPVVNKMEAYVSKMLDRVIARKAAAKKAALAA